VARAFRRKGARFVARLDAGEREVVVSLLEQTHRFLAPEPHEPTGDPFDDLVARLGLPRLKDIEDTADPYDTADMADGADDAPAEPRDPALDRLLPSAHRDDPGLSAEFRRLTEHGLREGKAANLAIAISALLGADGDKVRLDQEQAQAMVIALTDVRLLLGERLGLHSDEDADALQDRLEAASEDDPQLYLAASYDFLTWLQESLIQALMDV
jgi:Domain of unknown function (DUF2017)